MTKFGTDGIRGIYGKEITEDLAFKIGLAVASLKQNTKIVVGRDNRPGSKSLLESVATGIKMGGGTATTVGLVSTPCISFLTENGEFDYGIMITASHNPPEYNGIKIISSSGTKTSENAELKIEELINFPPKINTIGNIKSKPKLKEKYIHYLKLLMPKHNLKVVVDCSKGASQQLVKKVFEKGVIFTGLGSGKNINKNCGATHPKHLLKIVQNHGADIGFAFDGDADRVIVATKNKIYDGDNILLALAKYYLKIKKKMTSVVATIMTNMGLEIELQKMGINLHRTPVGDKYVIEEMQKENIILGGEQAGHIILSDFVKSGDGLLTSIILMQAIKSLKQDIDSLFDFVRYPQTEESVIVKDKNFVMSNTEFQKEIEQSKTKLNKKGRVVVRASGTESKIRIMVECESMDLSKQITEKLSGEAKRIDSLCAE